MKNLRLLVMISLCLTLAFPLAVGAEVSSLTDQQMSEMTGQKGISVDARQFNFSGSLGTLYFGDNDSAQSAGHGAFLSLCGLSYQGFFQADAPLKVDLDMEADPYGRTRVTGVNLTLSDFVLKLDSFTIDAVRVGTEPGTGASFGSFGIINMETRMQGDVRIGIH